MSPLSLAPAVHDNDTCDTCDHSLALPAGSCHSAGYGRRRGDPRTDRCRPQGGLQHCVLQRQALQRTSRRLPRRICQQEPLGAERLNPGPVVVETCMQAAS